MNFVLLSQSVHLIQGVALELHFLDSDARSALPKTHDGVRAGTVTRPVAEFELNLLDTSNACKNCMRTEV